MITYVENDYICSVGFVCLYTKSLGQEHIFVKTCIVNLDMIGDKEYQCEKCTYKTFNKIYFDDHLDGMTNYWKCPFCDVHIKRGTRDKRITHLSTEHDIQTIGEKVLYFISV